MRNARVGQHSKRMKWKQEARLRDRRRKQQVYTRENLLDGRMKEGGREGTDM